MVEYVPNAVSWEITGKCNGNCLFCYTSSPISGDDLDKEKCFDILEQIKSIGAIEIFFSGGEPFLREDIIDILRYADSLGFIIRVITNGSVMDESIVKSLKKTNRLTVMVSLQGSTKEKDSSIRDGIDFDKVVKTIELLVKHKVPFCVGTTISKLNLGDADDIVKKCLDLGVERIRFLRYVPVGRYDESFTLSLDEVEDLKKRMSGKGNAIIIDLDDFRDFEGLECTAAKTEFAITYKGDVLPCPFIRDKIAGNLEDESLEKIWKDSDAMSFFREFDYNKLKGKCGKCEMKETCKGGCRAFGYAKYGDIYAENPLCPRVNADCD